MPQLWLCSVHTTWLHIHHQCNYLLQHSISLMKDVYGTKVALNYPGISYHHGAASKLGQKFIHITKFQIYSWWNVPKSKEVPQNSYVVVCSGGHLTMNTVRSYSFVWALILYGQLVNRLLKYTTDMWIQCAMLWLYHTLNWDGDWLPGLSCFGQLHFQRMILPIIVKPIQYYSKSWEKKQQWKAPQ